MYLNRRIRRLNKNKSLKVLSIYKGGSLIIESITRDVQVSQNIQTQYIIHRILS